MSKTLECRLVALEAKTQSESRPRLSVLVMRGPDEQVRLASARAVWGAAELDSPEIDARFLG